MSGYESVYSTQISTPLIGRGAWTEIKLSKREGTDFNKMFVYFYL